MNSRNQSFTFELPLVEGIIKNRPNRFIMNVEIDGIVYACHCPATGRIGGIDLKTIPCLLSKAKDSKRKTPFTVEAISLDLSTHEEKTWIGINQNAANRYIEYFLKSEQLGNMVANGSSVLREQKLGNSRLDFLVGNTYIEVKTPLITLPHSENVTYKKEVEFNSFERFIKHITELAESLGQNNRAILLNCFLYDNPRFQIPPGTEHSVPITEAVRKSVHSGVEIWQINIEVEPTGVNLLKCFDITEDFMKL